MKNQLLIAAVIAGSFTLATPAIAANAVTNGSFETGNLSGWSQFGNGGFTGVQCPGPGPTNNDGNCSAFFGPVGSIGGITQTIGGLTGGQAYNLSFWLRVEAGTPNSFEVFFDNVSIQSLTNTFDAGTLYSFLVTPTGSSADLRFEFRDDPNFMFLDSVSLDVASGVPEPSAWAMMLLGFGAIGLAFRRSRRTKAQAAIA